MSNLVNKFIFLNISIMCFSFSAHAVNYCETLRAANSGETFFDYISSVDPQGRCTNEQLITANPPGDLEGVYYATLVVNGDAWREASALSPSEMAAGYRLGPVEYFNNSLNAPYQNWSPNVMYQQVAAGTDEEALASAQDLAAAPQQISVPMARIVSCGDAIQSGETSQIQTCIAVHAQYSECFYISNRNPGRLDSEECERIKRGLGSYTVAVPAGEKQVSIAFALESLYYTSSAPAGSAVGAIHFRTLLEPSGENVE